MLTENCSITQKVEKYSLTTERYITLGKRDHSFKAVIHPISTLSPLCNEHISSSPSPTSTHYTHLQSQTTEVHFITFLTDLERNISISFHFKNFKQQYDIF